MIAGYFGVAGGCWMATFACLWAVWRSRDAGPFDPPAPFLLVLAAIPFALALSFTAKVFGA